MLATLAQQAPPAGGSAASEVIAASLVGSIAVAAVLALGVAHRRRGLLDPLAGAVERRTGLPAWSQLPVLVAGASLLVAVWGYYWDVSIHIDHGRDEGAFGNPAHWFIIVGLDGIAFAGLLSLFLGDARSRSAVRLSDRWSVPVGGILLTVCGVVALAGFPLDDIWHRLFGQDVTAWGPTHVQMIGGASLSTLACWVLLIEGQRAAGTTTDRARRMTRFADINLAGAFLIGLSTLQVEFDFGVPQFRLLEHPVLVTVAASIALVAARLRVGRGGALLAVAMFLVVRVVLAVGIDAFDRVDLHVPLYVVSALLVEAIAFALPRRRQLSFGVACGIAIATVGFAAEWAWTRAFMPFGWTGDLLPEAIPVVLLAGIGGGIIGGLIGRALTSDAVEGQATPSGLAALGWLGVVGAIGFAMPMTAHDDWSADVDVSSAGTAPDGTELADVRVALDPPGAAEGASWFHVLSWQGSADGGPEGTARVELVRQPDGSYVTESPVPISGSAKTMLRLHTGRSLQAIPIYLPEDDAIPAEAVPAADGTYGFRADKRLLQREARTDNVALERVAYAVLALIAAGWMATMAWGLRRLERGEAPEVRGEPSPTASPAERRRPEEVGAPGG